MYFSKMHGLGNDFMVVDGITQNIYFTPEMIQRLASRHLGVGFDQLLVVEPPYDPDVDFHYRIFNANGNEVAMCGNGARCFARFVSLKKFTNKKEIVVSTIKGKLTLHLLENDLIKVNMGEPIWEPTKIPFQAQKFEKNYILRTPVKTVLCGVVSMGNPHCVVQVDDVEKMDIAQLGAFLESHERFPEKTNVGFMQVLSPNHIKLRVYERGCGETNACGSGACGAVAVGIMQGLLANSVQVDLKGGKLQIEWQGGNHPLYMTGNATHVYDGKIRL